MTKNNFIYATLATVILSGALGSSAEAVRWDQLEEREQAACINIHQNIAAVSEATQEVSNAVQCMSAAGARHQEKLPAVKLSVANFREQLGRVMGEQPEIRIDDFPHVSAEGKLFVAPLALMLKQFDALFDGAHQPKQLHPRLALIAADAARLNDAFHALIRGVFPAGPTRDQVAVALFDNFEQEGIGAPAPVGAPDDAEVEPDAAPLGAGGSDGETDSGSEDEDEAEED